MRQRGVASMASPERTNWHSFRQILRYRWDKRSIGQQRSAQEKTSFCRGSTCKQLSTKVPNCISAPDLSQRFALTSDHPEYSSKAVSESTLHILNEACAWILIRMVIGGLGNNRIARNLLNKKLKFPEMKQIKLFKLSQSSRTKTEKSRFLWCTRFSRIRIVDA